MTGSGAALPYARGDAELVGEKLSQLGFKVEYLVDGQATRARIVARLRALRQEVVGEDQVFIFFSGHGRTLEAGLGKEKLGYLVPADGRQDAPDETAISMTQLRDLAKLLKAPRAGRTGTPLRRVPLREGAPLSS